MELINSKISANICRRDAAKVADPENITSFVEANVYQYYVLMNTWLFLAKDLGCDVDILYIAFERNGLLHCIDTLSSAGTNILASYPAYPNVELWISDLIRNLSLSDAAQLLRFGKRFTLDEATILAKASITSFLDTNNSIKMRDRSGYPEWLLCRMSEYIDSALHGIDLSNLYTSGYFSPGAVCNTTKAEVDKIKAWSEANFGGIMYPTKSSSIHLKTPSDEWDCIFPIWNDHYRDHIPCCDNTTSHIAYSKAVAVPKSYKAYRIIAENDSTRQYYEQAVRQRMWDSMCRNGVDSDINLLNQDVNTAALAKYGSNIATIDLSSASDRVPWSIISRVFPSECVAVMRRLRSKYVQVNQKIYTTYMAFTSGSALCFIVESLFFWSITQVARDLYASFSKDHSDLVTLVYGDDIIVSSQLYDTVVDLLGMVHAKVNLDKSYNTGCFRESCGADWFVSSDGTTRIEYVTSQYWPRKVINQSLESLAPILELNTRLFRYRSVHFFLRDQVASLSKGRMTYTQECTAPDVFTDCLDLYEETFSKCRPPYTREAINSGILPENIFLGKARVAELVSRKSTVSLDDPDVQMYYYTQYLMHGPLYEDALMETLKVSSPRRSQKALSRSISFDVRVTPVF